MKNKVAIYFANGIGNFLLMTPAIQALSKYYNSKIDIVIPKSSDIRYESVKEICDKWNIINKIIVYPKDRFKINSYEILLTIPHCYPSEIGDLFKQKGIVHDNPNWMVSGIHEIEYCMNAVYNLGYTGEIPRIHVSLPDGPIIIKSQKDKERKIIAFCNGAALLSKRWRWERKKWDKWLELANLFENYYNVGIIYLGGKSEEKEGEELQKRNKNITSYAGKLSFVESVKALSQCNLLISTDTAIMHASESVQVPVVALFGATSVSKNRPYNNRFEIVRGRDCQFVPCQYHWRFNLCQDYKCMKSITVGDILKAVRKISF